MERKIWLEEAIYEYIKNTPNKDSADIGSHFKLRVDITLDSLNELVKEKKVRRRSRGIRYICIKLYQNNNN